MCDLCARQSRRGFLTRAAAIAGAATMIGATRAFADAPAGGPSPDEALARLKAGNQRFIASPEMCEADLANNRKAVAKGYADWCFDRRAQLPPEWTAVDTTMRELRLTVTGPARHGHTTVTVTTLVPEPEED